MLRLIASLILLLLPSVALADDASLLGPSSSSSGPSSTQSQSLLQPANPSTLQPANGAGASNTGDSQTLQQTASSDYAKLLVQGESDSPKQFSNSGLNLSGLYIVLALIILSGAIYVYARKTHSGQTSTKNAP